MKLFLVYEHFCFDTQNLKTKKHEMRKKQTKNCFKNYIPGSILKLLVTTGS